MKTEINQNKEKLEVLHKFLDGSPRNEHEIVEWASTCVALFSVIGVSESVIQAFLKSFENTVEKEKIEKHESSSDPLSMRVFIPRHTVSRKTGPFESNVLLFSFDKSKFLYFEVAFAAALAILERKEELERLIPKSIINLFDNKSFQNLKNALQSIESNYQDKDSKGILSPIITSTELVLNFIPELNPKKNISQKLKYLYEEKTLINKYNLNKEVVWTLSVARIVRNDDLVHSKPEHEGNITMYETVAYCHLLVLFIDSLFTSGQINWKIPKNEI